VNRYPLLSALAALAAILPVWTIAQNSTPEAPQTPASIQQFIDEKQRQAESQQPAVEPLMEFPDPASLERLDPDTKNAALQAIREYYAYRISGFQHRRRVFDWQLLSSKIIFVVVVSLVSTGIYFSGIQFHASLRSIPSTKGDVEVRPTAPETGTQIEASLSGVKVSSPVLGVIILVISFLFFYLYLVHIYPIDEIF
jgi:hypothetical protein